jgi:hypothetical protein
VSREKQKPMIPGIYRNICQCDTASIDASDTGNLLQQASRIIENSSRHNFKKWWLVVSVSLLVLETGNQAVSDFPGLISNQLVCHGVTHNSSADKGVKMHLCHKMVKIECVGVEFSYRCRKLTWGVVLLRYGWRLRSLPQVQPLNPEQRMLLARANFSLCDVVVNHRSVIAAFATIHTTAETASSPNHRIFPQCL